MGPHIPTASVPRSGKTSRRVSQKYPFTEGKFWLGRAEDATAIGYRDDRHICVVSGTRGGKGTSIIVNNLCFWPGSAVVVDPKGENATVTAARRGREANIAPAWVRLCMCWTRSTPLRWMSVTAAVSIRSMHSTRSATKP